MMLLSYTRKDEPFEVRKIALVGWSELGHTNQYEVEVYYPEKFHSVCYQMYGQDEMEILARLYRGRPNNVRDREDRTLD